MTTAPQMLQIGLARMRVEEDGETAVVTITGEVDIANAERIGEVLAGMSNLPHAVVLDLSALDYLDSTGISLVHELTHRLRTRAARLIVCCPPDSPPRRVLELTALHTVTPVVDELGLAIELARLAQ